MQIGMYQGAAALNAYEQWQSNVAHNLANTGTSGFKELGFAIEKEPMGHIPSQTQSKFARLLNGSFPEAMDKTNFDQAALMNTGKPTDLGLEGDAFFEVQQPNGQTMYTRSGEFHINNESTLVDKNGNPVLSQEGAPIVIGQGEGDVVVNRLGEIFQGETQVARVAVTRVQNKDALEHISGGFIANGDIGAEPAVDGEFTLMQGFKEGSNSSAIRSMIDMINISRSYESNIKSMQAFDSRYAQAIQQLGTT